MNRVQLSPEYFPDSSKGRPISNADIYVGIPDLDPEVLANQKSISVQQEDGSIVSVLQPVNTGAGGVPLYNGSPVTILVDGNYSLKVLNSSGSQIYYIPNIAYPLPIDFMKLSDYESLADAISQIGSTVTELWLDTEHTLTSGISSPSTLLIKPIAGNIITTGTFTWVYNGPAIKTEPFQWLNVAGGGSISFSTGSVENVYPEMWGVDGTSDQIEINYAVSSITQGNVILTKNYTTDGTIALKSRVRLKQIAGIITYSGSGDAIQIPLSAWAEVEGIHTNCTNDAATSIKVLGGGRYWTIRNVFLEGNGTLTNTGAGIHLDSQAAVGWIGTANIDHPYALGSKYGIKFTGAGGTDIITIINMRALTLVGRSSGIVPGSAGIYLDANSNGSGSNVYGGDIESFAAGIETEDGAIFGGEIHCAMENNTKNTSLGDSFNGSVYINGQASPNERKLTNGSSFVFMREKDVAGSYFKETRYDQTHVIYNADVKRFWGVKLYNSAIDNVDGAQPFMGGGFSVGGSHVQPELNHMHMLFRKMAWSAAAPTAGSWARGDVIWNTAPAAGGGTVNGWRCVSSGVFSTASTTGDTDGSTSVMINVIDTSGFAIDDYVSVAAGFPSTGPFRIRAITSSTLKLDTNSNSAQAGTAITTPNPTFSSMGTLP